MCPFQDWISWRNEADGVSVDQRTQPCHASPLETAESLKCTETCIFLVECLCCLVGPQLQLLDIYEGQGKWKKNRCLKNYFDKLDKLIEKMVAKFSRTLQSHSLYHNISTYL